MKTLNRELLTEVFNIQHKAGKPNGPIIDKLTEMIVSIASNAIISVDIAGNILVQKGEADKYPCVACHYDQVHAVTHGFTLQQMGTVLYAMDIDTVQQVGVGGDDLCGVYIALHLLSEFESIKLAFFADEEIGMVGSGQVDMQWFDDVLYVIEPDRNGYKDACYVTNGIQCASDDYMLDIEHILVTYGYTPEEGTATDIGELRWRGLKCPSLNISAGYFNAHTNEEFVDVVDLEFALNLTIELLTHPFKEEYLTDPLDFCDGDFMNVMGGLPVEVYDWYDEDDYDKEPLFSDLCDVCKGVTQFDPTTGQQFCFSCMDYCSEIVTI